LIIDYHIYSESESWITLWQIGNLRPLAWLPMAGGSREDTFKIAKGRLFLVDAKRQSLFLDFLYNRFKLQDVPTATRGIMVETYVKNNAIT
jgi:hypothetical protein